MVLHKYLLPLLIIIFHTCCFAQEGTLLRGAVITDSLPEAAIHIINVSQKTGMVNSASGKFEIRVNRNDTLWFTSVQHEKAEIVVTEAVLQKKFIEVKLKEVVIALDEVNISTLKLTGNLTTDTGGMKISTLNPPKLNEREIFNSNFYTEIPSSSLYPENWAYEQNRIGEGKEVFDLNINVDLIVGLLKKKHRKTSNSNSGKFDVIAQNIRTQFNDDFFINTLGIEQELINDFLFYLDDKIQNSRLLASSNALVLTELLISYSNSYKVMRAGG